MDDQVITKIDDKTISVERTTTKIEVITNTYNYDFLLSQKVAIQKQKDDEIAQRDKELAEVDALIAEAKKLGIDTPIAAEEPVLK